MRGLYQHLPARERHEVKAESGRVVSVNNTSGTKEWMPNNRNRCDGCKNNCKYCYGKLKAIRYKRRTEEDWHEMRLLKIRQSTKKADGGIMFPTTHDLHIKHVDCWGPFLKEMLENGNDVLIVTKPEMDSISWIVQNLVQYKEQIEFRFTIGTNDSSVTDYWEPGAPKIAERCIALSFAHSVGWSTSVSMEPLLMESPEKFVSAMSPTVTGDIWIGIMNHYPLNPEIVEEALQIKIQSRENIQKVYDSLKDNPQIRWKDSIRELLGLGS